MMTSPKDKAAPKSDLIETILRRHGPLPVRRIVQEMQLAGVDAKPNNVRSLMSTLFKRFVSLKPGVWQLQDPALSYAEKVIVFEEARGGDVLPERKDFLRALHKPKTPHKTSGRPKSRNGHMTRETAIKELNQLLQELEENKESLQVTIDTCQKKKEAVQAATDACHVVIGLFEERPPHDVFERSADAPVDVVTPPVKASVEPKSRPVKRAPVGKERPPSDVFERPPKRKPAGSKAFCPRCSATAVVTEDGDDWGICISCGWNSSKVS